MELIWLHKINAILLIPFYVLFLKKEEKKIMKRTTCCYKKKGGLYNELCKHKDNIRKVIITESESPEKRNHCIRCKDFKEILDTSVNIKNMSVQKLLDLRNEVEKKIKMASSYELIKTASFIENEIKELNESFEYEIKDESLEKFDQLKKDQNFIDKIIYKRK